MTFSGAVRTCVRKFVTFSGRAARPEYWWFFLFLLLCNLAAGVMDAVVFGKDAVSTDGDTGTAQSGGPFAAVVSLVLVLPHLAVAWRRMHDTGRSGLFVLLPLILMVTAGLILVFGIGLASSFAHGGTLDILFTRATLLVVIPTLIVLFVSPLLVLWWLTRPSQPGSNEYGPNPHEVSP